MDAEYEKAHKIILDIYDTALEPHKWPEVLDKISHFVGAIGALVIDLSSTADEGSLHATHYTSNYDADTASNYLTAFRIQELEDQRIFAQHSEKTDEIQLISDEVLAPSRELLEQRDNVKFIKSIGITYRAGALLNKDLIEMDRFAFQFNKEQGALNPEHIRKSNFLLPHLAKALNVGRPTALLASQYAFIVEGLNKIKSGVCIIDNRRNLIVQNKEFERQTDAYDVFNITNDGRLEFKNLTTMKTALDMFSSIGFHGRFGARPRKEALNSGAINQPHNLCIEIIPLDDVSSVDVKLTGGSIIFCLDTSEYPDVDVEKVSLAYQFTGSEKQVFRYLIDGFTNPQIADQLGKSVETVNSQVKSILSKTMAANRTQLVRISIQTGNVLTI